MTRYHWQIAPITRLEGERLQIWSDLHRSLTQDHPLLNPDFVNTMLNFFAENAVISCTLTIENQVQGIGLLERIRWGCWSTFAPTQAPLSLFILNPKINATEALKALCARLPGAFFELTLLNLDFRYNPIKALQSDSENTQIHGVTMSAEANEGFEKYWENVPGKLRSNLRRYFKRAEGKFGQPRLKVIADESELGAAVDRYGVMESKGWKDKKGTALHPDNTQGKAYRHLIEQFGKTQQAKVFELFFGTQLVASRLMIHNKHFGVMLKTTFDEQFAKMAPGRILLRESLAYCLDQIPLKNIEFYTNATKDQLQWATQQREIWHITLYSDALPSTCYQHLRSIKKRLLKR